MNTTKWEELFSKHGHYLYENMPWLADQATSGFENFKESGLPTRKTESYRFTKIAGLLDKDFNHPNGYDLGLISQVNSLLENSQAHIVTMNGQFIAEASSIESFTVKSLENLDDDEQTFVKYAINKPSADGLNELNKAFSGRGILINISSKTVIDHPIKIIHLTTSNSQLSNFNTFINIENDSKCSFAEYNLSESSSNNFAYFQTYFELAPGSKVDHIKIMKNHESSWIQNKTAATVRKDSTFSTFAYTNGGNIIRNQSEVNLIQTGAHASVDGLYITKENEQSDHYSQINHLAPHTTSSQLYKGILSGESHAVFNGRVYVAKDAQQINSEQLNKNMLLSNKAKIDTQPQLEIFADDVKCAHGATVGQIEDDELFYLMSRGLSRERATQMMKEAFALEGVINIEDTTLKNMLMSEYRKDNE